MPATRPTATATPAASTAEPAPATPARPATGVPAARAAEADGSPGDDRSGGDTSSDKPSPDQSSPDQPSADQSSPDQSSPDQPSPDQPSPDQPSPDQPSPDQPSSDQPAADQPGAAPPAGGLAAPDPCAPAADPDTRSAGYETSAAKIHNWGKPVRVDEFDGTTLDDSWNVYDGPGHAGNGRRTPSAVSLKDGILTITGDSDGATAGMAWQPGQMYGRWEGRVKAPASDPSYNALLLLWPTAENFPVGGEIDFMEMMDHTRQETNIFLHYGPNNSQVNGKVKIDATQWHNWAVEWTPTHVAAFVDGKEWWRTTNRSILPPGPMHLCIQLDWFPKGGSVKESNMHVDWVKQYKLDPTDLTEGASADIRQDVHDRGADAEAIRQEVTGSGPAAPDGVERRRLVPNPVRAPGN